MKTLWRWGITTLLGFISGYFYYRWMLSRGFQMTALNHYGLVGYWLALTPPAFAMFAAFFCQPLHRGRFRHGVTFFAALALAVATSYVALMADVALCAFITRGICD